MPQWDSLAAFGRDVERMMRDLSPAEIRKITHTMGRTAQAIAAQHAGVDLGGDRAFSGWNRGNPIALDTRLRNGREGATIMAPTRSSAGPWTVAEQGRNQGNASGFSGPGINTRTGVTSRTKAGAIRKVRARRSRRWNGTTKGKGTATEAGREIDRKLPVEAGRAVLKVMRKRFDVT